MPDGRRAGAHPWFRDGLVVLVLLIAAAALALGLVIGRAL